MSKFTFILAEKASFAVTVMCRVLRVSKSGFYAWRTRPQSAHALKDKALCKDIAQAHNQGRGNYGTRRIHGVLKRDGWHVGHKRVTRLRKQNGLLVRRKRRFKVTTDSKHNLPVAPDLLARLFRVPRLNTVWVGDVTHVWTLEGWLYLAVMMDLCSRRVVGWATGTNNDRELAIGALRRAETTRHPAAGLIHHTDRGSVYASLDYQAELERIGCEPSMSRKGNCWDNAVAESGFPEGRMS